MNRDKCLSLLLLLLLLLFFQSRMCMLCHEGSIIQISISCRRSG